MTQTLTLDKWQQRVMQHHGNITIRAGRQVGKSTVISMKAHEFSKEHENTVTLIIAASLKQAGFIYEKVLSIFNQENDDILSIQVRKFQERKKRFPTIQERREIEKKYSVYAEPPTKTKIVLKNESRIYCLPAGRTGAYIRGLTIDVLIADEAAYIPEIVWSAVLPMIAVSREVRGFGWIILLSTPFGKGGYFYNSHHDPGFLAIHVSSETCPRINKQFLITERQRMTKMEYAQEYLGEFVDEWNQFFPTSLIKKCMTFIEWDTNKDIDKSRSYYLGVDIARYGKDETAFVVAEMDRKKNVRIVKAITTENMSLTDTVGRIIKLDDVFFFRKVFIDDGGIGGGVLDMLLEKMGRKVIGINNARRSIDKEDRKRAILKEDLYSNALMLMENNKLEMIHDPSLMKSLKCIVFEYTSEKNLKLYGDYSHLAEAFVRACWCFREKGLKLFLA